VALTEIAANLCVDELGIEIGILAVFDSLAVESGLRKVPHQVRVPPVVVPGREVFTEVRSAALFPGERRPCHYLGDSQQVARFDVANQ
jgi:hypothetical protein